MDFYETLGVSKNASSDDIKKAYKKLAMKHHPDRGGDSDKLSKINEAYTVLKNPEKRKQYDHGVYQGPGKSGHSGFGGPGGFGGFGGFGGPGMNSAFEEMFRQGGFHTRQRNANVQMNVTLNVNECVNGKKFSTTYMLRNGEHKTVDIDIPPGMSTGDTLRVQGAGDNSNHNAPPGDLHLSIVIRPPRGWEVHDNHLLTSVDVSVFDLMIGTSKIIETPKNKKIKLKVPAGTQNGTVLQITGEGLPSHRTKQIGNIHVAINSFIPTVKSENLINKIQVLKDEISEISK